MANFSTSYTKTMTNEGGYDNNPTDVGGETYKGVARRYYPSWPGWSIIDSLKSKSGFPQTAYNNTRLNDLVKEFFKANYWDVLLLSEFPDQDIADEMFDTGVNMGISRAAKFLQRALNVLNKKQTLYPNIDEDGKIGDDTLKTLSKYLSLKKKVYLLKVINILQGNHYIEYMGKDEKQETFAYGWLDRVEISKV